MLANQFVTGLRHSIKSKVAGTEGEFEQLVTKIHFEEVKLRDLAGDQNPKASAAELHSSAEPTRGGEEDYDCDTYSRISTGYTRSTATTAKERDTWPGTAPFIGAYRIAGNFRGYKILRIVEDSLKLHFRVF